MSKIIAVVCFQNDGGIGYQNQLLFEPGELPGDMKRFKELTLGTNVIMGRKTWESLGNGRPLRDRKNTIITSNPALLIDSGKATNVMSNPFEAISRCKTIWKNDVISIAGGGNIYEQTLHLCDEVYTTEVACKKIADAFFPIKLLDELFIATDRSEAMRSKAGFEFFFGKYVHRSKRASVKPGDDDLD